MERGLNLSIWPTIAHFNRLKKGNPVTHPRNGNAGPKSIMTIRFRLYTSAAIVPFNDVE